MRKWFSWIRKRFQLPKKGPEFNKWQPKKPTRETIEQFWKKYDETRHPTVAEKKRQFYDNKARHPVRVGASTLGTVRKFHAGYALQEYLRRVSLFNKIFVESSNSFKWFSARPIEVLGIDLEKNRTIERVQNGINLIQLMEYADGYHTRKKSLNYTEKKFWDRMIRKQVNPLEMEQIAQRAYLELCACVEGNRYLDTHLSNIIILDYNPKTKRCLLTLVDPGLSERQ